VKLRLSVLGSKAPLSAPDRAAAAAWLRGLEADLHAKRAVVRAGWGPEKVHKKGKRTTAERVAALLDPGSPFFEVGTLVNWGRRFAGSQKDAPGAGVVTGFGKVHGRWVVVIANENTVASGSWWPLTPEKIQRAQQVALRLRLPVVYLVDCSGLFLPEQALSFPGRTGSGHIFTMNARLAAAGVPQIAGVMGDCIAGGGYMPLISDRVTMTEQAYMVIAGAALIQGAKALKLTSLDIGGPEVHVHQSGCADRRVPDDDACIAALRADVAELPSSGAAFYRHGAEAEPPLFDAAELHGLFPADHRQSYDIREVLARLCDGSLFHEVLPHTGPEIVVGVGRVNGLWMGFAANVVEPRPRPDGPGLRPGGILYREGIAKLAAFSRACNDDGIPLVWLQDIAGFDIGVEAEAQGLLGYGSSLIYSNSTNTVPMFTVLLRKASGAGYFAMAGLPYEPVLQLATPLTRLSVMEGRTLAIATYNSRLDDDFRIPAHLPAEEQDEIRRGMERTAARIDDDMDPVRAAARLDIDEIIALDELRPWMEALAEMAWQSIGHRRTKNPRIWSLHDLAVLAAGVRAAPVAGPDAAGPAAARGAEPTPDAPDWEPVRAPMEGTFWSRPAPGEPPLAATGAPVTAGQRIALIEVMKTFNPVRVAGEGVLARWAVADGAPVEAGQLLGWVRPAAPGAA